MTGPTGVPTPDEQSPDPQRAAATTLDGFAHARDQELWEVQEEIVQTAGILLRQLDEISLFNGGVDNTAWLYKRSPGRVLADTRAIIADVREYAQDAEDSLDAIRHVHDWLVSGRPLRCYGCGQAIDPARQRWLIDESLTEGGLAVHVACHQSDAGVRARNLAATVAEDHYAAVCEDRTRDARPRAGDVVELDLVRADLPGGPTVHTVQGVWDVSVDGALVRVEVTVPGPAGTPAVGERVDPLDAAGVRVVWLAGPPPAGPVDGRPVADDVACLGAVCPRCAYRLVPGLPVVWLAGRPVHRACALTAGATVTAG